MSSNVTGHINLMDRLSTSLLEVVKLGLLPYIVVCFNILIILHGVGLNVTLMVMFKRWKRYKNPGTTFIIHMAIADILACVVCLPVSTIAVILKSWPLPEVVCLGYAVASRWFHHLSFTFLIFCAIERTVLIRNVNIHCKTFGNRKFVGVLSLIIYVESFVISALPLVPGEITGIIVYDSNIYQCGVVQGSSHLILNLDFIHTIVASAITYISCLILIYQARNQTVLERAKSGNDIELKTKQASEDTLEELGDNSVDSLVSPRVTSPSMIISETNEDVAKDLNEPTVPRTLHTIMTTGQKIFAILKDNIMDETYHLAVTYFLTWCFVETFWMVYPLLIYIEVYGSTPIWGGARMIAIMIGTLSYCVKPIVYLSHNRHFQRQTKAVLPKTVKHTAAKIKFKVTSTVERIDQAVFNPTSFGRRSRYPKSGRVGSADSTRRLDLEKTFSDSRSSTELSDENCVITISR